MSLQIVAFGGGTDSTAMLIGLHERGEKVDLILFADTGGERPETYVHVSRFSEWLVAHGMPEIITVTKGGIAETLEGNCLRMNMLPSIAYGYKTCSSKFKIEPQDKFCNNWQPAKDAWAAGGKVVKLIGYDASEERRARIYDDEKYSYRYPLIQWGWDRDECIAAIDRAGIQRPGKSACFFCPSSKKHEIFALRQRHPDLLQRALAMEANANLTSIKGLGRDFAWRDLIQFDEAQIKLFPESLVDVACGCYDGDAA